VSGGGDSGFSSSCGGGGGEYRAHFFGVVGFTVQSPNFSTFKEPKNRFQETNSAKLCSLAGRYDNPIPTRFLAPIDCLKIPTQGFCFK
jgi:hypothetical protein